jgi:hypothetical protein
MKSRLFAAVLPLAVFAAPLAAGCQKQNVSEVKDTVVFQTRITSASPVTAASGGIDQVTVYATCDWILTAEDWFTVTPSCGKTGISESTLTTTPNTTGADRTGTITLKAGSYSGTYTFTQKGI